MLKIGVLVSGGGTNLQAVMDKIAEGYITGCQIVTVVSSKPDVYALDRAKQNQIPCAVISRKSYETLEAYDKALIQHFGAVSCDLIVLAGFLSLLGEQFTGVYKNRMINIHPSLIPSFCGKGYYGIIPHRKALEYGVKVTGATVHFVEPEYDSGPVILQKAVEIKQEDTPETLQRRVMEEAEWDILPKAIKLFVEGKLVLDGRKVLIKE